MRITGGTGRGRTLRVPAGEKVRPTSDKVKQALFNILAGDVVDSTWWDLFAGTGAVGIEALSRGAALARFSDLNRAPIETIKWNLEHCKFTAQAEIRRGDAFAMLAARPDKQFEFIYVAPPQYKEMWSRALLALDENPGWLTETGWAIMQIDPKEFQELELNNLEELDQRKYGSTLLMFFGQKET